MSNGVIKRTVRRNNKTRNATNNIEPTLLSSSEGIDISNIQNELFRNNNSSPKEQLEPEQMQEQEIQEQKISQQTLQNKQSYSNKSNIKRSVLDFNRTDFLNKHSELSQALTIEEILKLALARSEKEKNPTIANAIKQLLREINGEQLKTSYPKNNFNSNKSDVTWGKQDPTRLRDKPIWSKSTYTARDNNYRSPMSNYTEDKGQQNKFTNNFGETKSRWGTKKNDNINEYVDNNNEKKSSTGSVNLTETSNRVSNFPQRTIQQRTENYDAIYAEHMKTRETRPYIYNNKSAFRSPRFGSSSKIEGRDEP